MLYVVCYVLHVVRCLLDLYVVCCVQYAVCCTLYESYIRIQGGASKWTSTFYVVCHAIRLAKFNIIAHKLHNVKYILLNKRKAGESLFVLLHAVAGSNHSHVFIIKQLFSAA